MKKPAFVRCSITATPSAMPSNPSADTATCCTARRWPSACAALPGLPEILGRVDKKFVQRQRKLLETLELPVKTPPLDPDKILSAMMHDKKVQHGKLRFVLPSRLGSVELVDDVDPEDIRAALEG